MPEEFESAEPNFVPHVLMIALRYNAESYASIDDMLEIARRAADSGQYGDALTILQYAVANPHYTGQYGSYFISWFTEAAPGIEIEKMSIFLWEEVAYALKEMLKQEPSPPILASKLYIVLLQMHDPVTRKSFTSCGMYSFNVPILGGVRGSTGFWHRWACPEYVKLGAIKAQELKEKKLLPPPEKLYRKPEPVHEAEKTEEELAKAQELLKMIEQELASTSVPEESTEEEIEPEEEPEEEMEGEK